MPEYSRVLIGICAPSIPSLGDRLLNHLSNNHVDALPEFSHVVRFNRITYSYYHLDGRVVSDISNIMTNNIPIIRYKDLTDESYDIVKFVSKLQCPEDSVMIYQYDTPMETAIEIAPGVVYFQIYLLPTMDRLYERVKSKPFPTLPGFETVTEQVTEIYNQKRMLLRYRYDKDIDTLILGSYYENWTIDNLIKVICDYLFKIDSQTDVVVSKSVKGPRINLFRCIENLELKKLRKEDKK